MVDFVKALREKRQKYCVLDYETRSKADLKKVGGYEYARHPSTQILCVSWQVGTRADLENLNAIGALPAVWSPAIPGAYGELKRALLDPSIILIAHNAFFEQVITRFVLSRLIHDPYLKEIPVERWLCTASLARATAFPGKLELACAALGLAYQKDMVGHRLMLKMSKPRKPTKTNPNVWHQSKDDLKRLMDYCASDTAAERALFLTLPPLPEFERKIWCLDQRINWRGFKTDRPLVKKILGLIGQEMAQCVIETQRLTGGEVRSIAQRDATLTWLEAHGCYLPNLQKKTVADAISARLASGPAHELLELRADAAKTSTAKYMAFESRSRTDGRVRDNLVYHQASTGRWSGSGVQPQNFPRASFPDPDQVAAFIAEPETDLELIRLIYEKPMQVFSSLLRSMIIPTDGCEFFDGDFSGVEVRALFWIAKHDAGLRAYFADEDLYIEQASDIYARKISKDDKEERQLGKKVILGCGFGMGKDKFFESCKADGMEIDPELAATAVASYRRKHWPVVKLWSNLEKAAIAAVKKPGFRFTINRTTWFMQGKYLYCQLPSGRRLTYYGPEIKQALTPWGEKRPVLYHWDVHPLTRKWAFLGTYGGKLTENVVQATARDLMASAMVRLEPKYPVILTVHDEILCERETGSGTVDEFRKLMTDSPGWAKGLPIKVDAWQGPRYRK